MWEGGGEGGVRVPTSDPHTINACWFLFLLFVYLLVAEAASFDKKELCRSDTYTNAQSIGSKLGELAAVTQDLEPDIILLTETWCNSTITNASLTLENYNLESDLRHDRNDTTAGIGGGLLVYSRKDLRILP